MQKFPACSSILSGISASGSFRARRLYFQAVEKGQKLGQIAFISKNLSMSEGLIKV